MAKLAWHRVERRGRVLAHWESTPARWSIWKDVMGGGRTGPRIVVTRLLPGCYICKNVADAKARAQRLEDGRGS